MERLCKELFPVGEGQHATASEVSVTYAAYPEAIKRVEMSPKIAPVGPILDADDYRRRFPDGRIGSDPSQATPEKGERIIAAAASALASDMRTFSLRRERATQSGLLPLQLVQDQVGTGLRRP